MNKYKLLVVDDHRIFIDGLKYILQNELSCSICDYALNGKEAIEKSRNGDFDIILMDVNMPLVDGVQATREIRLYKPDLKIIFLSMLSEPSNVVKALKAGANAYVLKSAGTNEIADAIRAVFKNEIYISKSISHFFGDESFDLNFSKEDPVSFMENLITPREKSILKLIVEGFTNKEIAGILFISEKTTETHRKNMLAKLKLPNTASLVKFAIENKLV